MKILLSAYACEPNKGSEPEVGWRWAITLSKKGHEVYVLTRKNNIKSIQKYLKYKSINNLNFIYFDFPNWVVRLIKGKSNAHAYVFMLLWQIGIFIAVKPYLKKIKFDLIHHVTFVNFRLPSFLCLFKIPFIFGPVAGGDVIPYQLKENFSFYASIKEKIREWHIQLSRYSFLINMTLKNSSRIFVNSLECKKKIPTKYQGKTKILLAIAAHTKLKKNYVIKNKSNFFNICFAGNLIDIKGVHILIKSFLLIRKKNKNVFLNIIGNGNQKKFIKRIAEEGKVEKYINWHGKLKQKELFKIFKKSNLLFFPALRDSGGMVILEAMSYGLPAAVLNVAGPGQIVDKNCGIIIDVKNKSEDYLVKQFANQITELVVNKKKFLKKSKNAYEKVKRMNWNNKIDKIYNNLEIR